MQLVHNEEKSFTATANRSEMNERPRMSAQNVDAYFGKTRALKNVSLDIPANRVMAIIGPSGCGKSTFLRNLNRMHEVVGGTMAGKILLDDQDIHQMDAVSLRRRVGMVFQKPNPFPSMSIFDNVAVGLKLNTNHNKAEIAEVVERSLQQAALWDQHFRGTAAKTLHCPDACGEPRGNIDG